MYWFMIYGLFLNPNFGMASHLPLGHGDGQVVVGTVDSHPFSSTYHIVSYCNTNIINEYIKIYQYEIYQNILYCLPGGLIYVLPTTS